MIDPNTQADPEIAARQGWMGVLARAGARDLDRLWEAVTPKPSYRMLRAPETGLVMVQGRVGGRGQRFNFGEMSVTRCTVRLENGTAGCAYVAGRDHRHAEQAAVLDGLLQDPDRCGDIEERVIAPLRDAEDARRQETEAKTASTKVDFFTLVRGEDE